MIITITDAIGTTLYTGDHVDLRAAVVHCAQNGVSLAGAVLRNADLQGANLSGLIAPNADLRGANMRNVTADRRVGGRILDLSAAWLDGATITGTLTFASIACTRPTAMRATMGPNTNIKGTNLRSCPDVIELTKTSRGTRALAIRNGSGWLVHTGDERDGANACLPEAQAITQHGARSEYAASLQWLASAEGATAKATIDARPVGSGEPVKPRAGAPDGVKLGGSR